MTRDQEESEAVVRRRVLAYVVAICAGLSSMVYLSITGSESPADGPDSDESTPTSEPPSRERIYRLAENIEDHGGIADDDSIEAIEANVRAIHDASVAAENNTVYLPEGNWFIGALGDDKGEALRPGCPDANKGAAGLGFVGEGPDKTFLYWGALNVGRNNNVRYCAADHSGATWKNLTYDGRWRTFASQGYDFDDGGQWGIDIEGDASGDITLENVRLRGMAGNGIFMGFGLDVDLTIDRCTFHDNGIGINRATNGNRSQHHISAYANSTSSLTVRNSEFRLCSGSVINCDGPANGDGVIRIENVYAEGAGQSFHKIDDTGKVIDRNVYFRGETQELVDELASESRATYCFRLGDTKSYTPDLEMHDIEMVNLPGYGLSVTNGYKLEVQGGTEGPIAMKHVATAVDRSAALRNDNDGSLTFNDIGSLSVHRVNGKVCALQNSNGSIDTLRWDIADSLGDTGKVSITNEDHGADSFAPKVPSRNNVGMKSATNP